MERAQGESDTDSLTILVSESQKSKLKSDNQAWGSGVARITSNRMSYNQSGEKTLCY